MLLQRKNQTSEIVKNIVLVGFILLFLATSTIINKTTDYNKLMIEISLGMLAFIAIFYSFILRKDIKNKRHEMISSEFGRFKGVITKTLSDISKHQKSKPSYSFVKNNLQKISNELDAITLFVLETDMKKQLLLSFSSYFLVIIIIFVDLMFATGINFFNGIIVLRVFAYIFFLVGLYNTFTLLRTWHLITERTD